MRTQILLAACAFSIFSTSLAAPSSLLKPRNGTSCPADALTAATWTSLNIDSFLSAWSAANVTTTPTDNVQSLAASFGAPNFFCGLDDFCNAGQPCLPLTLPSWYVMVAIQNWNSYMNAMNTALGFASSMVSLTLPGIVSDFYPDPTNNVTPLEDIGKVFTTVLGVVPFTGALSTVSSAVSGGLNFVSGVVKPPTLPNLFLDWSNIATSLATVLEDYQNAISSAISTTLNAQVNSTSGINSLLVGGNFLGVTQNFTESDIQSALINSTNVLAISLTWQAQKIFLVVSYSEQGSCDGDSGIGNSQLCVPNNSGGFTDYLITQNDGNGNANNLDSFADLLINKYGISQQQFLVGTDNCWNANGGKQLTDPFNGSIPIDPTTQCLFNILVCNGTDNAANAGIVGDCQNQGLDV